MTPGELGSVQRNRVKCKSVTLIGALRGCYIQLSNADIAQQQPADIVAGGIPWAALAGEAERAVSDNSWNFTFESIQRVCSAANALSYYDDHIKAMLSDSDRAQLAAGGALNPKALRVGRKAALVFLQQLELHSGRVDLVSRTLSQTGTTNQRRILQAFGIQKQVTVTSRTPHCEDGHIISCQLEQCNISR